MARGNPTPQTRDILKFRRRGTLRRIEKDSQAVLDEVDRLEIDIQVTGLVLMLRYKGGLSEVKIARFLRDNPDSRFWRTVKQVEYIFHRFSKLPEELELNN